ncbi:MAG TPA: NTP transferase domain-containing protein [Planctomycetota bacterium]|nr:NTP transferase domain-containing protein [Planctomycetota bacterium]
MHSHLENSGDIVSLDTVRAVVLAAGRGVRMKSERAKVLHELLGRPLIHHVLRSLRKAGVKDIVVVVGHQEADVRKAAGEGVAFARQAEQKGTGHAVLSAEKSLKGFNGQVFVLAGDAPLITPGTLKAMVDAHKSASAAATVLTCCIDDPTGYGRISRDEAGRFLGIVEHNDATEKQKEIQEVNSGAYVFDAKDLFRALKEVKANPKKGEVYLTDVLPILMNHQRVVATHRASDPAEVYGINSRRDLVAATNFLRWRILEAHMDAGVTIVDPSTTFIEEDVTIGADTVVLPYTVIEHDVAIGKGCEVGPFSHLRPGAVLDDGAEVGTFVEVKKSRIGANSKAKHLTYLGDATLGRGVNIGAGTITANYDGKNKLATVIGDGVHIGSNTVLVAPVKVGKNATTGAGAIVLRDVAAGDVVAGVPARSLKAKRKGAG